MTVLASLSPTITNMIRMDHTHVLATFHQYTQDKKTATKQAIANNICLALEIHAQLEEEIFYPAMERVLTDDPTLLKSTPEHDEMRSLISNLRNAKPESEEFDATLRDLMREVIHHVADEETVLLPKAEKILGKKKLQELGAQMTKRRVALLKPHTGKVARDTIRSFSQSAIPLIAGFSLLGLGLITARNHKS